MLAQITAPHFVAGIVLNAYDLCEEAAPILRERFHGRSRIYIREECARLGWKVKVVREGSR